MDTKQQKQDDMKNILVPTDFSDCARAAEEYALDIAKKANAETHFLHLLMTPTDWKKLPLEKEKNYPETKAKIGHADNELKKLKRRAEKLGLKILQEAGVKPNRLGRIMNEINQFLNNGRNL